MPPKIITRYELSETLNNYSKNNIRKLYEYEGAVYYFDIHFLYRTIRRWIFII
jgi:hypothetical protein